MILMDETGNKTLNVTNLASSINIPAGGFRIFGNQESTLSKGIYFVKIISNNHFSTKKMC